MAAIYSAVQPFPREIPLRFPEIDPSIPQKTAI
jgi:hypothetical protein